jgi:hypothetical protein
MTSRSPLLVLAATSVAALALAGCGSDQATLATFAGHWQGHARGLIITKDGRASESIYTGCCYLASAVKWQLSRPRGTPNAASATATVTSVRIGDRGWFSKAHPPPQVGESRRIKLRDGVITATLTGSPYCGKRAKAWNTKDWLAAGCGV